MPIAQEVRRIAQEVLLALADADAASPPPPCAARLACCVRIDGNFRGQLLVHASAGLATMVARRMFGRDPDSPFATESQEALRELASAVAGHLELLLGNGHRVDLPEDLPLDAPCPDLLPVAEAVVDHYGEKLEIRVFAEA